MNTCDRVEVQLTDILTEILGVDREEVVPSARFFEDLGGESIDVIDLDFRCQQRFGISARFQDAFSAQSLEVDESGALTPDAIATIKERLPFLDPSEFGTPYSRERLTDLFTVSTILQFVRAAIASKSNDTESRPPSTQDART